MSVELRTLARTGLKLSALTLGSMEFGSKIDEAEAGRIFDMAIDAGVNIVDTANCYAGGRSEEIVGRLIAAKRGRLLLATKFSVPIDAADPNLGGTSRHNVIAACEASLRRLNTDHIDVYYIHRPFTWFAPARCARSARRASPPGSSWRLSGAPATSGSTASPSSSRRITSSTAEWSANWCRPL
jgi:aryl-alcohol dehydrogenase-like predicted oxidoreductase